MVVSLEIFLVTRAASEDQSEEENEEKLRK